MLDEAAIEHRLATLEREVAALKQNKDTLGDARSTRVITIP